MGGRKEEGGWVEIYCCGGMRGMNSVGGVLLRGNGRQEMQFSGLCRSGEMFSMNLARISLCLSER